MILEIDLQGRLPLWVITKSNVVQGSQINRLPKAVEKYIAENMS